MSQTTIYDMTSAQWQQRYRELAMERDAELSAIGADGRERLRNDLEDASSKLSDLAMQYSYTEVKEHIDSFSGSLRYEAEKLARFERTGSVFVETTTGSEASATS